MLPEAVTARPTRLAHVRLALVIAVAAFVVCVTLAGNTDLNLVNLETTLTRSAHAVPKVFNFKAAPDRVRTLRETRIDVCNLANNHILDFGVEGLEETLATLDGAGILRVGAGRTIEEDGRLVVRLR